MYLLKKKKRIEENKKKRKRKIVYEKKKKFLKFQFKGVMGGVRRIARELEFL